MSTSFGSMRRCCERHGKNKCGLVVRNGICGIMTQTEVTRIEFCFLCQLTNNSGEHPFFAEDLQQAAEPLGCGYATGVRCHRCQRESEVASDCLRPRLLGLGLLFHFNARKFDLMPCLNLKFMNRTKIEFSFLL